MFAQGMVRSSGIGFRGGFWDVDSKTGNLQVSSSGTNADVKVIGAGGNMYFFSRAYDNVFFEMSIGGTSNVDIKDRGVQDDVKVETIIPFLIGLRYDFLSNRVSGAFHPYVTAGVGPYWLTNVDTKSADNSIIDTSVDGTNLDLDVNSFDNSETTVTNKQDFGAYLGVGTNIVLASWFALNFDTRYHFVDMESEYDYNGMQFTMGFSFMWGQKREAIKVLGTQLLVSDIYPAYYQFYSTYPIAMVTVKNMLGQEVEVNVRCTVQGYSERPKDSGFVKLEGGETRNIPVTAFFGPRYLDISQSKTAIIDLDIEARAAVTYKQNLSQEIVIHTRNAWSGDMEKLGYYLSPEDPQILELARSIAASVQADENTTNRNFEIARAIFQELNSRNIRYLSDPNIVFYQDDRVQFAQETLELGHGDCDDLVVLYSSLLESVGIKTAFVEVRDPEKNIAHLYLLFNSGLDASQSQLISTNEKRYIVREDPSGIQQVWVPVETTLISKGFEEAWKTGASIYLEEGILRNGIAEQWVKIIDQY